MRDLITRDSTLCETVKYTYLDNPALFKIELALMFSIMVTCYLGLCLVPVFNEWMMGVVK